MKTTNETKKSETTAVLIGGIILGMIISGFTYRYSINHLLVWFDKPAVFPYWAAMLIGFRTDLTRLGIILALVVLVLGYFI